MTKHRSTTLSAAVISVLGLCAVALAGCAQPEPVDVADACTKVSQGKAVPECTQLFEDGPGLKLPEGTENAPVGAFSASGDSFITVAGAKLNVSDEVKAQFNDKHDYANYVYRGTVSDKTVSATEPVLHITEDALMEYAFAGRTLVGTISSLVSAGSYNMDPSLPVLIQLDTTAKDGIIAGKVANATTSVKAPDGSCVAALPTDSTNPLQDIFTSSVMLQRFPSMHAPFDDELVLAWTESASGMGTEFYPSVAMLFGGEKLGESWRVTPHAAPDSGPSLQVTLQDGASESASC